MQDICKAVLQCRIRKDAAPWLDSMWFGVIFCIAKLKSTEQGFSCEDIDGLENLREAMETYAQAHQSEIMSMLDAPTVSWSRILQLIEG